VGTKIWTVQRGLNTKLHLAVYAHGLPVRALITAGTTADCTQAAPLNKGLDAQYLLADRGYDSNDIVNQVESQGAISVIAPRKNNKNLYTLRHRVENIFLNLKRWRGIATRYAKDTASFMAAVQIRCIALWVKIL